MSNIRATQQKEIVVRIVQKIIEQYDGVFDLTREYDSRLMAEHIVRNLKRHKLIKTYEA